MKDKHFDIKSVIPYFLNKHGSNNITFGSVSKTLRTDENYKRKNEK